MAARWRLQIHEWFVIDQALDDLAGALATGNRRQLNHALAAIERCRPEKTRGSSAAKDGPPPDRVRERIDQLIHTLSLAPEGEEERPPDPSRQAE